jgi:LuxR family maltose regulon positive regulatory protein
MTWAARLIERYFDAVYRLRGEPATIQRWISALPAGLLQSRPRLLLAQAQLAAAAGEMEEVQRFADAAERAAAAAADEPFEPSIGRASSLLVNIPAHIALCRGFAAQYRGDAEATAAFASKARAELGQGDRLLDYEAHCDLAVAEWLRGRLAAAERALVPSIAGWADKPVFVAWGRHLLG